LRIKKGLDYTKISKLLKESKKIILSTHILPDGDGLGAEFAIYHFLKKQKKICHIYNPDPIPKRYQFLDPKKTMLHGRNPSKDVWDSFDLWLIVDTNDPRRLDHLWSKFSLRAKTIAFLDHHSEMDPHQQKILYPPHAQVFIDSHSSSIGELLFQLFKHNKLKKMTPEIALGLYVSIMTDTNSFRYGRTTPLSHQIAARAIEVGVNPEEVYQNIYSSKEISHIHLLGHLLRNVKMNKNGKIAWMELDLNLRKKHMASADDTQSFLNLLLLLQETEVVCLFREEDNGKVRVSIKSKGKIVINQVAIELGGGGHPYAAGLALSASLRTTVQNVIKRIESLL